MADKNAIRAGKVIFQEKSVAKGVDIISCRSLFTFKAGRDKCSSRSRFVIFGFGSGPTSS